jgi:hypothetical protein
MYFEIRTELLVFFVVKFMLKRVRADSRHKLHPKTATARESNATVCGSRPVVLNRTCSGFGEVQ